MARQNKRNIKDRSQGHLANELFKQKKRIEALESNNGNSANHSTFGMNPWIAIGSISAFLVMAFGGAFSWQINRIDKINKENIERISTEYESRITWLLEQQKKDSGLSDKQCKYELSVANNKLIACVAKSSELLPKKQGITNRSKSTP